MQLHMRAAAAALILGLAACSGGGSMTPQAPSTPTFKTGQVTYHYSKPLKAALERLYAKVRKSNPHFVSPNATKMIIALSTVNGVSAGSLGFNQTITLSFSSGNCTTTGGNAQCTATTTAPVATDCWVVSSANATKTLGSAPVCATIAVGSNNVSVTLDPVVGSLAWSTTSVNVGNGTAAGNSVTAEVLDPSGAVIVPEQTGQTQYNIPLYLKSDSQNVDYVAYQCSNTHMGFFTSASHVTNAQGNTAAFTDGVAISSSDPTQAGTNHANDPAGVSVTAVGNNGTYIYYDGIAQAASATTMTCTLSDSQGDTPAVFTANLQNGTVGWTINGRHRR